MGEPDEITSGRPVVLTRRRGRPTLTALAVTAALVGGTIGVQHLTRPGRPPLLALQGSAAGTADSATRAAMAPSLSEFGGPATGFGGYRLAGTLPDGPAHAHAWRLKGGAASAAAVRNLAGALGEDAAPERVDDGWVLTNENVQLVVRDGDGWFWTYGGTGPVCEPSAAIAPLAPDTPVSSADGCGWATSLGGTSNPATSVGGGTNAITSVPQPPPANAPAAKPLPPSSPANPSLADPGPVDLPLPTSSPANPPLTAPAPPASPADLPLSNPSPVDARPPGTEESLPLGPAEAAALAAAQPVLARLGLGSAEIRATQGAGTTEVVAEAVVSGLPTVGLATSLTFDSTLTLVEGSGWLAAPRQAASYPLVSATAAFDQLVGGAVACPPLASCVRPLTQVVTGARLGLLLDYAQEGDQLVAMLVPAWLFVVEGQDIPLPVVAIDPSFLGPASPAPGTPASGPAGEPASPPNGQPAPVPPGEPASPPDGQLARSEPASLPPAPNSEPAGSLPGSRGTPAR